MPQRDENGHDGAKAPRQAAVWIRAASVRGSAGHGPGRSASLAKRCTAGFFTRSVDLRESSLETIDIWCLPPMGCRAVCRPAVLPLVVCLGIGTLLGSHTGGSLYPNIYVRASSRVSHAVVTGAGTKEYGGAFPE
ncbi:MAG: hypothetical protein ACLTQL_08185 [Eisenbergiella sp.]